MRYIYTLNPDMALVKKLKTAVIKLNGQCPCVPSQMRSERTLCLPCVDAIEEGVCICGMYKITSTEDEVIK